MSVFPTQSQLWYWREVCWMKKWNVPLQSYATRPPPPADAAKHAWAEAAAAETSYLWPMGVFAILWCLFTNFLRSPIGFIRALWLGFRIDTDFTQRPRIKHTVPLIIAASRMADLARRDKLTHIHTHTAAKTAIICMMVERLTGIKWSMVVNAHIEWWGGAMSHKFRESDRTFFVTQWMVEQMRTEYAHIPQDKYVLGRVGVDATRWKPAPGPRQVNEIPIVLTVGRLVTSKGIDLCIRAIKILKDRNIRARLRIGGEGVERPNLEALIKELDVADSVELLGNLSEERYLDEMSRADIFILASHEEPMGVVYMEAAAMEVPAIGTNRAGAKELITDGGTGLLVPPRSPPDIANALEKLIKDPDLRRTLGKNAREKALQEFDSRIWAAKLHEYLLGYPPPAEPTESAKTEATREVAHTSV